MANAFWFVLIVLLLTELATIVVNRAVALANVVYKYFRRRLSVRREES